MKQDQVIRTLLTLNMVSQLYSSIVNPSYLLSISQNIFIFLFIILECLIMILI